MKLNRKLYSILLVLFLTSTIVCAQRPYKDVKEAMTSQGKLAGDNGPANVNWIENGSKFSFVDKNNNIKIFDPSTLSESTVFDVSSQKFPGSDKPFQYQSFEWSADSKFIVFSTNFRNVWRYSGISDYYLYSLDTKNMSLIAKDAYTAQLSPDGKKVGYERNGDLYALDLQTMKEKQLTNDGKRFFYNGRFGWEYEEEFGLVRAWEWSHDSNYIAFWQSDETKVPIFQYTEYADFDQTYEKVPYPKVGDVNPTVHIGVIDVKKGSKKWMKVDCGDGYIPRIYWTAVDHQLAIVQLNRKQNDMTLFFADALTGNAKVILNEKSDQWVQIYSYPVGVMHYFTFPADAKEFFLIAEKDGWPHIYRYDYNGNLVNQVTKGSWEAVDLFKADEKNKVLYYLSTESSPLEKQLYSINFDGSNKQRITNEAGLHRINFSTDGGFYIDNYSSLTTPKQVELHDISGKLLKKLVDNSKVYDFMKEVYYSTPELQSFTTSDGQRLDFSILKPYNFSADKKYPLLFDVYGGPEFESVTNQFSTDGWMEYMAQLGYIVVRVNNRGSAAYGTAFKKIVYGQLGAYECKDFAETAKYLSTFSWVDKDNIAIYGHSYGGFTSSYALLNYPDIFKAAIVASPVTDWRNYDAIYTERYMGVLPENLKNYNSSAVLSYVKNYKGHMFIAHSTFDDNVHVINSMQLLSKLIENGKDADLRLYQKGGHGIANDFNSYILLHQQYTDFLNRYLKPTN